MAHHNEVFSQTLSKGLELLKTLPDTPERTQQELTLQIALGRPLIATKGYAAPEVEKVYSRARELCQQVGETPQLFPALWGLWVFYLVRAEFQTARELGEQLLRLAQRVHNPVILLGAHSALGTTLFYLGKFVPSKEHLQQSIALYEPQKHPFLAFRYGQDPGGFCRCFAGLVLWFLGYPDQALKRSHEALTLAQDLSHPFSLAFALNFAALLHQLRREGQAAQELAEATIKLSTEQGFPFWVAMGTILRGWMLAKQGQEEGGIVQMRQGLAAYRATGAEASRPYFLALLAEACGGTGQTDEGLALLAEALVAVHKNGGHFSAAELYRLKGELLLVQEGKKQKPVLSLVERAKAVPPLRRTDRDKSEKESEAEACFQKAIDVARRQSAKSLELRAVMSLSRLWQRQGKKEEARQMLAEIYGWFTEGFGTTDLKEAKALLEDLGRRKGQKKPPASARASAGTC
jgi:predicted ATPase